VKRPFWVATGVVIGIGGTLWAEQRVRRGAAQLADALSAEQLAKGARRSAGAVGERMRGALEAGRQERARTERELWEGLEAPTAANGQRAASPRRAVADEGPKRRRRQGH